MKTFIGIALFAAAALAHAQPIEADLDGNAGALQASELRPQPQARGKRGQDPFSVGLRAATRKRVLTPFSSAARL